MVAQQPAALPRSRGLAEQREFVTSALCRSALYDSPSHFSPLTNHFSLFELRCPVAQIGLSDSDVRINRCLFHLFVGTNAAW
jgi:hypothetical protein